MGNLCFNFNNYRNLGLVKMNQEFETKRILREGISNEDKVKKIMKIVNFRKESIQKALEKGGTIPEVYWNIVYYEKNDCLW